MASSMWCLFTIYVAALVFMSEGNIQEVDPVALATLESLSKRPNNTYLVLFYATWCGFCKEIMPTFEEAAQELPIKYPGLYFAKIDASKYKRNLTNYGIRGYPTVMILVNGTYTKHIGKRTVEDLGGFVSKKRRVY